MGNGIERDLHGCFLHGRFDYFESLSAYCYCYPIGSVLVRLSFLGSCGGGPLIYDRWLEITTVFLSRSLSLHFEGFSLFCSAREVLYFLLCFSILA